MNLIIKMHMPTHYPYGGWITFDREWWYTLYKKEVEE